MYISPCLISRLLTLLSLSNHSIRLQAVVKRFPENLDMFNRSKLVPGEHSYTEAVNSTRLNSGKQYRIIILGDSLFRGIHFREFNYEIKNGYAKFKTFLSSDTREILTMLTQP